MKNDLSDAKSEVETLRRDLEYERERADEREEEISKSYDQTRELERELREVRRELDRAEAELARYRQAEERERLAEESKPSTQEKMARSREAVEKHRAARVHIEGDENSGPGLVVETDERHWIYLLPNVLSGNATLEISLADGTELKNFGRFEMGPEGTMARLEVTDYAGPSVALGETEDPGSAAPVLSIDDTGAVEDGRSDGEREGMLQVDRTIANCPVGSPVFHGESAELIGFMIETSQIEPALWPDRAGRGRRTDRECFVVPRDGWREMAIGAFLQESKMLDDVNRTTRIAEAVVALTPSPDGLDLGQAIAGDLTIKDVLASETQIAQSVSDLDDWLKKFGARASQADLSRRVSSVYEQVQRIIDRQAPDLAGAEFSAYHEPRARRAREWREEAENKLQRKIEGLQ